MQNCMAEYPSLYSKDLGDDDELGELLDGPEKMQAPSESLASGSKHEESRSK